MLKKIIFAILFLLPVSTLGQTAALPIYACTLPGTQATVSGLKSTNYQQGIIPSCLITVYLTGTTTLATTTPQSPFTANTNGSIPPIYAAINQGYDVVLSGGIAPNTYPAPVTLTGLYPGQSITSCGAITPCTIAQGGTGATTAAGAWTNVFSGAGIASNCALIQNVSGALTCSATTAAGAWANITNGAQTGAGTSQVNILPGAIAPANGEIIESAVGLSSSTGGGTDTTAVVQGYLNRANTGTARVRVNISGIHLVSASLQMYSNTTIHCEEGGGFYLANGTNAPILTNAHQTAGSIVDSYITVEGPCQFYGNYAGQSGLPYPNVGIGFYGVDHLTLNGFTMNNSKGFAVHVVNVTSPLIEHITVNNCTAAPYGQDGIHVNGPANNTTIDDIKGCTGDDFVALNADDTAAVEALGPGGLGGVIDTASVTNLQPNNAVSVIRLLSGTHLINHIVVSDVKGTARGVVLDTLPFGLGPGNYGSVLFNGVNVSQVGTPVYDTKWATFGGVFQSLKLDNITTPNPGVLNPIIYFDSTSNYSDFEIHHWLLTEDVTSTSSNNLLVFNDGGFLSTAVIDVGAWLKANTLTQTGALFNQQSGAGVRNLTISNNITQRFINVVSLESGTYITTLNFNNNQDYDRLTPASNPSINVLPGATVSNIFVCNPGGNSAFSIGGGGTIGTTVSCLTSKNFTQGLTFTSVGSGLSTPNCASASCTSLDGLVYFASTTFSTGAMFNVVWPTTVDIPIGCNVGQQNSATYWGFYLNNTPSKTGFGVSVVNTLASAPGTLYLSYRCWYPDGE